MKMKWDKLNKKIQEQELLEEKLKESEKKKEI